MSKIIYKNTDSSIVVLTPTHEALSFATIEQIAEKDVPFSLPYKIVLTTDILTDRTYRDAWEWDDEMTPDGFGGESNEFDAELLAKYETVKNIKYSVYKHYEDFKNAFLSLYDDMLSFYTNKELSESAKIIAEKDIKDTLNNTLLWDGIINKFKDEDTSKNKEDFLTKYQEMKECLKLT